MQTPETMAAARDEVPLAEQRAYMAHPAPSRCPERTASSSGEAMQCIYDFGHGGGHSYRVVTAAQVEGVEPGEASGELKAPAEPVAPSPASAPVPLAEPKCRWCGHPTSAHIAHSSGDFHVCSNGQCFCAQDGATTVPVPSVAVPPGEAARLADVLEAFAAFRQRDGEALTASWNRHDVLRERVMYLVCANANALAALVRAGGSR